MLVFSGQQLLWLWLDSKPGEKSEQAWSIWAKYMHGLFQFEEILIWIVPF